MRRFSGGAALRSALLAGVALALAACTSGPLAGAAGKGPGGILGGNPGAGTAPETRPAVELRAVPRHVLVAPQTVPVWLWDRPGGPAARGVRIGAVASGTRGKVLAWEKAPRLTDLRQWLELDDPRRWPVEWVKVDTPKGKGWVRTEFVFPR